MSTYEIWFNLIAPQGINVAGHANVSFVVRDQNGDITSITHYEATNKGAMDWSHLIKDGSLDGIVQKFSGNDPTDPGREYISHRVQVSQVAFDTVRAYAESRLGDFDYSGATDSCFHFFVDVFKVMRDTSGYQGNLPLTPFDFFPIIERVALGGLAQLGALLVDPSYAALLLLAIARFGPLGPYGVILAIATTLVIGPVLKQIIRDPLVLDLDGDGVEVTSLLGSEVHFDYDGDGFAERTAWVSPDDGILVHDINADGLVTSASELFGSPSQDGFEVLEVLDTNGDGRIDAQDEDFGELRVWQDLDGDGVSDPGELRTLDDAGIVAIELTRSAVNGTNNGNGVGFEANFLRANATTGTAQTIYFQTDRQETADPTPEFTMAEGVDKLPQLPRSGQLLNLAYVLSNNSSFRADWVELTDTAHTMSSEEFRATLENMLMLWSGVDAVNPNGRGNYVDGRHLAFVEKFFGETYSEIRAGQERTYPATVATGRLVESTFEQIVSAFETLFLAQVSWSVISRAASPVDAFIVEMTRPYFAYSLLDFRTEIPEGEEASPTPGNLETVAELIVSSRPLAFSAQVDYFQKALSGLEGMVSIAFDGSVEDYAEFMAPLMADIEDPLIRQIATELASLTAREGTVASEGLVGDEGDNVFIGGKGDDGVDGKDGNDIFIYRSGDGHEWLNDTGLATDTDTLILTDLDPSDITLNRRGDDLFIIVTATGAIIEVNDFFKQWGTASNGIEQIRFADDTVWDRDDIKANTVFTGSPGNNLITDSAQDDVIHGLAGNDYIQIGAGSDTILYGMGDGSDVIEGTSNSLTDHDKLVLTNLTPDDVELSRAGDALVVKVKATGETVVDLYFFSGSSSVTNWNNNAWGIESISFANGETWGRDRIQLETPIRGNDQANGLAGSGLNDTFIGGNGDDGISSDDGSDTFIWAKGDGNDFIDETSDSTSEIDTLILTDVSPGEVNLAYHGSILLITIVSTGEVIEIGGMFSSIDSLGEDANQHAWGIDRIQFGNGAVWDRATIYRKTGEQFIAKDGDLDQDGIPFTDGDFGYRRLLEGSYLPVEGDSIFALGGSGADLFDLAWLEDGHHYIDGYGGDDTLIGADGHDIIIGGDGNDTLRGHGGHDILDAGAGNDELHGGSGLDRLTGGDGNDEIYGNAGKDYIFSGYGDDIIAGGAGDDIIDDDQGSDTYIWAAGDGHDIVAADNYDHTGTDVLVLTGLNPDDVTLARLGAALIVTIKSTGETFTVEDQFHADALSSYGYGVEIIRFANGTEWDETRIQQEAWVRGTDQADDIAPSTLAETVVAGQGDDVIRDTTGSDTYLYASGDGNDYLDADNYNRAGTDTLWLTDLNAGDVELSRYDNHLFIRVLETDETITVEAQFYGYPDPWYLSGIEQLKFADGTVWDEAQIQEAAWIRGTNVRDTISSTTLDETIAGGQGDDYFTEQNGGDTYVYANGDGNDIIHETSVMRSGTDTLHLVDLLPTEVELLRIGSDLVIIVNETEETITAELQFFSTAEWNTYGFEQIRFADGTLWNEATINYWVTAGAKFYAATSGNDVINGSYYSQYLSGEAGNDTIDGMTGSDTLYGGVGNDKLIVSVANTGDVDTLDGASGTDTASFEGFNGAVRVDLVEQEGIAETSDASVLGSNPLRHIADIRNVENVTGTSFSDSIAGEGSANILDGGAGDDTLDGRSGADTLIGGAGDDTLIGGLGNDLLQGGAGSDTYSFGFGSEQDTVEEISGGSDIDTVAFTSTVTPADIRFYRRGNDLEIGTFGTADLLVVKDHFLTSEPRIERFTFVDGTILTAADVAARITTDGYGDATIIGTFAVNTLNGTSGDDVFVGLGGNDTINTAAGNDTFVYAKGDGSDFIDEELGSTSEIDVLRLSNLVASDILLSHVGNDLMIKINATGHQIEIDQHFWSTTTNYGIERIDFADGTSWDRATINAAAWYRGTTGADTLSGSNFNDTFHGGTGNDTLNSTTGSDTFIYASGDGNDFLNEDSGSTSEIDVLRLTNLLASDIVLSHVGTDLMLKVNSTGEQIEIDEHFYSTTSNYGIERIEFADGTSWDRTQINSEAWYRGTAGVDTMSGSNFNDTLHGAGGNDIFNTSTGSDTFVYASGDGNDLINEGTGSTSDIDALRFTNLNASDITLTRIGTDLMVDINATGARIEVDEHFWSTTANWGVERFEFADGTVWNLAQINSQAWYRGTSSGETITGSAFDDNIDGLAGNDTLNGSTGADQLVGGAGNDSLTGGTGDDTFVFKANFGLDTVQDFKDTANENDILEFSTSIFADFAAVQAAMTQVGADVLITVDGSNTVTLKTVTLANLGADDFRLVA